MSAGKVNLYAMIFFIPIFLLFGLPFILIWCIETVKAGKNDFINEYFLLILLSGIIVHELLHGIIWAKYANNGFKSIKFGVKWKVLTVYCHCKEPLQVKYYSLGGVLPGIVLGIIPSLIALVTGNSLLIVFGILFTWAACGDMFILWKLRKLDSETYISDHPSKIGFYIENKNEICT